MARHRTSLYSLADRMFSLAVMMVAMLAALDSPISCAQAPNALTLTADPVPSAVSQTSAVSVTPPLTNIAKKPDTKLNWNELTLAQQHALAPLVGEWNKMEFPRKEKWLVIGNKFTAMQPAEQERMQERMREWVKLTPAQRRSARESYARAKKLNADKKSAQWKQYQQLSEEQKKKLAQNKLPKHIATLPIIKNKAPLPIQLPPEALK